LLAEQDTNTVFSLWPQDWDLEVIAKSVHGLAATITQDNNFHLILKTFYLPANFSQQLVRLDVQPPWHGFKVADLRYSAGQSQDLTF
jgi:hypothetical protein